MTDQGLATFIRNGLFVLAVTLFVVGMLSLILAAYHQNTRDHQARKRMRDRYNTQDDPDPDHKDVA